MSAEIEHRLERVARAMLNQPVIQNNFRSAYVEVLVADLLGEGWRHVGANWSAWDLTGPSDVKLEVKQSAAKQTWHAAAPPKRTQPKFDIALRKGYYDERSVWIPRPGRLADIYVFAWHPLEGADCDHRDAGQWRFFASRAADLPDQKSITLSRIRTLSSEVGAAGLRSEVLRLCSDHP